jgi:DNA-binding LacI/PurR family transcriptional regulator
MLGWPEGSDTGDDRWRGWERGLLAAGAAAGPVGRCANDVDEAAEATYALMRDHPDIDAIFCVSDTVAAGVYRAFAHLGIQVGKQVSVVGFDDGPSAAVMPVPLTTITQPVEQVAETVIDMLETQRSSPVFEPQTMVLTPSLTVRESS